jgi:perosamine synthetase
MIPVFKPKIEKEDIKEVSRVLSEGYVSGESSVVKEFEKNFSKSIQMNFGIAVSNGTTALEIAIQALKLEPGSEVILPTLAIISTVGAVIKSGAVPVFIDSDLRNWNMKAQDIESKITKNTRVILVVHTYGLPVDMRIILDVAKKYNLIVIEDAAEAHGLFYNGRICGSMGDISTFSFYANKAITCGEGGMICTNSDEIAERCKSLRNLCMNPDRRFYHSELGSNARLSSMQAALGNSQLQRLNKIIESKKEMAQLYRNYLQVLDDSGKIYLPLPKDKNSTNSYWIFGMVNRNPSLSLKIIQTKLMNRGIETRPFFWPLHLQPALKNVKYDKSGLTTSEFLGKNGFYVPFYLDLENKEIEYISNQIKEVLN